MKKILTILFFIPSVYGSANVYYTAPAGNDDNTGTIDSPWFSLNKAWTVVDAGDTIYMRGGTYSFITQQFLTGKNGTAGNLIKVWNYPGERPVITRSAGYTWPNYYRSGTYFTGNYFHWKGIEFTGFFQPDIYVHSGFMIFHSNNCIFELLEVHHNAAGLTMEGNSSDNLFLNCDSHHNYDPITYGGDADGFGLYYCNAGTFNSLKGCRAWANSDDGFDTFDNLGFVLSENCWAWDNGYIFGDHNNAGGNGEGWKLGYSANTPNIIQRKLINCVAFDNRLTGFHLQEANCRVELYNNISFNNGIGGYHFDFQNRVHIFRNNIAFNNSNYQANLGSNTISTNNSYGGDNAPQNWTNNVSDIDFISLVRTGVDGPRQPDGSLPVLDFLHLIAGSDLIDSGINVGIPYNGISPDRGAFETGGIAPPPPNVPPFARAGIDQTITLPLDTAKLNGLGSSDPDGTISAYTWVKIAGPAAGTISNPSGAITSVTGLVLGVYLFELTVTDDDSATNSDTIQIIADFIPNIPPIADAGIDQIITIPANSVTLNGSVSSDLDGIINTYVWAKISGPVEGDIGNTALSVTAVYRLVQGVYLFTLIVTDDDGATDTDTMQVTVNAAPNIPPTAAAGSDQVITLPTNNVSINGSASTDPDGTIATYLWTKVSGPVAGVITTPASALTTVTGLVQGVYLFELIVTDNNGAADTDTMQVTVNAAANIPPVAAAGADQTITLPVNNVSVDGSASTDPDGTIASYLWTKISGPVAGVITSPASVTTTVTGLVQGVYLFELTVTDNNGAADTDTLQVTVNPAANIPPTAAAGTDQTITLPVNNVSINGSASADPDGTIASYLWTKVSGPVAGVITTPASVTTTVTGLVQGVYLFELTVTDNNGAADTDTMQVTVNPAANIPPTAAAGADQVITLPVNNVSVDGSASIDPDGTIASYLWTKVSGPVAGVITSPASALTTVTGLVQGVYLFELTVTDNNGAADTDTMQVTVNPAANIPPTAAAGADQVITLPTNNVSVDGSASIDPDGTIASYAWVKISGPVAGVITSPASALTTVTGLVQGVYLFELIVTDNNGAADTDTMQVTVNPAANIPPTAAAGTDQTITLPVNNVSVDGSASTDPDGTIATYLWTKVSGPVAGVITTPASALTTVTGLVQGVYLFELIVTDNNGAADTDTMQVTVNPAANIPPTAAAGTDQVITLPTNNVSINGSASTDPDGTIATYLWTKVSGPVAGVITTPASVTTTVTGLVQGVYLFELTVTDNSGAADTDTLQVTVNPAANIPPTAAAGIDQTITLPVNNVSINGSASTDPDGTIATYLWTKVSGPVAGVITTPASALTTVTGLVQGVYLFELTVTDNNGAADTDTMQVTVNPAANIPPVAAAGIDQTITLPVNNVSVDGSASTDPDGTIATYLWTKVSGPVAGVITTPASALTTVTGLVQGVYLFELTVTDNSGAADTDTMQVTVNPAANIPPTAAAGTDQTITLPVNNVSINGSASTDPDGTIASYLWTKVSGPVAGVITTPASALTTVTGLVQGVYLFELTVTDNNGAAGTDTMQVTVNAAANIPPTAAAGTDQVITLPTNNVSINGSASTDPDGTIASYAWVKISGPVAGVITSPASALTTVTGLVQGVYLFELTVTDNNGAADTDTMQVTVNPAANIPPVAAAGIDQTITLPVNNVSVDGSASTDPDGTIASYAWVKISGPVAGVITSPASALTTVTGLVQGVYLFELIVTDNNGAADTDTMQVTVNPAANIPPTAAAGTDQTITLPVNNVSVDGSASTDPDGTIATYLWTKVSGPVAGVITTPASALTTVTGLVQGVYLFELIVTDNNGAADTDTMQVTVNPAANIPPTAAAGTDQTITLPVNNVSINGSASTDPDGTIASYLWTKVGGPVAGIITSPASALTTVTGLVQGVYLFELTVTDNNGAADTDTMQVTVNPAANIPPVAAAGADQVITLPTNNVSIDGSASADPDGTIASYLWTKISGPVAGVITSPASVTTTVTGLVQGVYLFELTVTDNNGAAGTDTMQVTVNPAANIPPVAVAGADQIITLPTNNVSINGSASSDPDGTIATYLWTKVSGPVAGIITSPASALTTVTGLVQGVYLFELTVTDNNGAAGTDTMQVTVNPAANIPPVAVAGADQVITLPTNNVSINGSASTDPDGTIATYLWTKISGPVAGVITSPASVTTTVTGLVQGVYLFELTVTDNSGAADTDTLQVTVNPAANIPPTAAAGIDQTITLPVNNVSINGSASADPDGTIASYLWTKVSGPVAGVITTPASVTTTVTGLVQGVYLFELTVTDNNGAADTDTMQVTVNPAANIPPTAAAGADQVITLPVNNVSVDGSASIDPDGTIASYLWTKVSGPVAGVITSPASALTTVTGLVQGVYLFELTVTDNNGAVDTDTMQVTVNAAANIPPTAAAGADQIITLPTNNVSINGSASSDPDGTIATYLWTKVSGPVAGIITSPASALTTVTGLVQGVYLFELTVTDNNGAAGTDTMQVTVNPAANIPPVAAAGTDQVITLPTNNVSINGSASTDPDGTIASYAWVKISGPVAGVITSPASALTTVTGLVQGVYLFELTVTDNNGAADTDTMQVTVNPAANIPPTAVAGTDQVITLPTNSANLKGVGTDADGTVVSYQWTKISGPSQYVIVSPLQAITDVTGLVQGIYSFELRVTDNLGATGRDTIVVTVNAAAFNQPPVADAGPDKNSNLPADSVTVAGTGTDTDGTIAAYQWRKITGPAQFIIVSPTQATTLIKNLAEGVYQFELTVTDNLGAVGKDTMEIKIEPALISNTRIFPNPANSVINIKIDAPVNNALTSIRITDARGVIIFQEQFLRTQQTTIRQIDINKFANGFYLAEIITDKRVSFKFLKQ